jgi:glycosyltransferase involved in cell wall biosynthesis
MNVCDVRVGVLIPDRGDRPKFLAQCLAMMNRQTLRPVRIEIVNDAPMSNAVDITWRYRLGYERIGASVDVIAFIENDDWYHPQYLESMVQVWLKYGQPDMLGLDHTVYYHIRERAWFTMHHHTRSSAMNTLIKPTLNIEWPLDWDAYTDAWLWTRYCFKPQYEGTQNRDGGAQWPSRGKAIITPNGEWCIGMKHGTGLCGGKNHTDNLHRYVHKDADGVWLRQVVGEEDAAFYLQH